jgi:L-amino acid N-acyltransferase YncA
LTAGLSGAAIVVVNPHSEIVDPQARQIAGSQIRRPKDAPDHGATSIVRRVARAEALLYKSRGSCYAAPGSGDPEPESIFAVRSTRTATERAMAKAHKANGSLGFPKELKLPGGRMVAVRLMDSSDRNSMLAFARSLPPDDLLFLRTDITEAANVDEWIGNLEKGNTATVIAEADGQIVGYASVHTDQARWTRRVGEIRLQVGPSYRGAGLGRHLAAEIFRLGQMRGLKKMAAMMTPDQAGARTAFEKLGFQVEALLQDWVVDREGRPRDVIIMSHDLEGLSDQMSA